jgi:hypothetical protein
MIGMTHLINDPDACMLIMAIKFTTGSFCFCLGQDRTGAYRPLLVSAANDVKSGRDFEWSLINNLAVIDVADFPYHIRGDC